MSASKKKTGAHAAAGPPLLTAAQIEKDCPVEVQALGNRIAAHLQKMRDYEAKAHEKAGVELRKADDHWHTVTQLLAEAKAKCDVGGFKAFKEKYCPNLSRSRIYELLAIGSGKKTLEEIRAEKRESVAKSRAKVSTTDPPVVDKPEADHVTQTLLESGEVITSAAVTLPPGSGNETKANGKDGGADTDAPKGVTVADAEAEVTALNALKAKINANRGDEAKIDPKTSAHAFTEFEVACTTWLPKMNSEHLQEAIDHFAEVVDVPAEELMPDLKRARIDVKIAKTEVTALKRKLAGKLPPRESRAAAWSRLAGEAAANIEELISLQAEFESAKDAQPDNLQDGPFGQKCDEICGIDLESALSTLQEAEGAEVPLGFGRD
jgi:hypothetical protein